LDTPTVLIIAVGLAMDAFAVSVTYGLSFRRRRHGDAFKIAAAFGLFQAGMPVLGWLAGLTLRAWFEAFDHWIALGLLCFIGGKMIRDGWRGDPDEDPEPLSHSPGTLLLLALATSIDALAVGLALSVLHVSIGEPVLVIGVVTFVLSYAGIVLGHELTAWLRRHGRRAIQTAGGLILIGIGLRIVYSHLVTGAGI
jgi:putative Mn2+ efflux pump MntP